MAISAFPFDGQDTTEAQYSTFFRELQDSGVIGGFGDASLRVTADSTGMQVKIAPGSAIIRGHCLISTATETRAITAAGAQPRIDAVVARLDPATDSITLVVLPGAPAATNPAPPTLAQTDTGQWDLLLALVTVAAGTATIASSAITERRPWIGQRVGVWSNDTRPTSPRTGRLGLNTSTSQWEWYHGSGWVDLAPTVTWASITGKPATFTPSVHQHSIADVVGLGDAFAYRDGLIANRALLGHTHRINEIYTANGAELYTAALQRTLDANAADRADIRSAASSAQTQAAAAYTLAAGKANAYTGSDGVRFSAGPLTAQFNREAGANRYQTWMDAGLEFGRAVSSRRYKDEISDWDVDVEAVLSLVPKTFHRKVDDAGVMDFGAIAEDVHDAGLTELVYYDDDGHVDGIREHHLPWALLAVIRAQQAQINALAARLDARDA